LSTDVIRQHRLLGLSRKDDYGQLPRTQSLSVLQDFNLLKILDVYSVTVNAASI